MAAVDRSSADVTGDADSAAYRPSHLQVLRELGPGPSPARTIAHGGIVVPAYRPFHEEPGLRLAARLALHHGWDLLVVCSGRARPDDFPADLRDALGGGLTVRALPDRDAPANLHSLRDPLVRLERSNDAAAKRNLGIALAVRAGWRHLLFLDDDVSPADGGPTLDEAGLARAVAELEQCPELRAVSWSVEEFPDNSVVGHARRSAGRRQTIFVGSAALLVRCDPRLPFFPGVYNEDWLFLIALAQASSRHTHCIAKAGTVRQLRYEPFSPARARSEEPGDIIAEGLMNLLEDDGPGLWATATTPAYWRRAMNRRAALLAELIRAFEAEPDAADARRARTALRAALHIHRRTSPEALRNYVAGWRADLPRWHQHLTDLAAEQDGAADTHRQLTR